MHTRIGPLAAFTKAITSGQPRHFEATVKAAYAVGADREDLLMAVEVARILTEVPAAVVAQAYATIHAWHWMAARRPAHQRELVSRDA